MDKQTISEIVALKKRMFDMEVKISKFFDTQDKALESNIDYIAMEMDIDLDQDEEI